jgi:type I restriction-modification system DNA methylase subunit/restriction endonuclease S subunit
MGRSTVHYADSETNNILKRLHNKLRPAGTPVERVEYIIELLLLRIFEAKIKQDEIFTSLRKLFEGENYRLLFSHLISLNGEQILSELNKNIFPFYSTILSKARTVITGNLPQKMQDHLVLMEEVFINSNFTNNVKGGVIAEVIDMVNEIDEKYILKTDLLGDAIESALSETGGTKDLGLYRTPDHIRQMMVEMVDPDFTDTIFDPACGTAGFLFDAYDYVIQKAQETRDIPPEHIANMFYRTGISGVEYSGRIRKMAAVNMYIRGLNPHNIDQGDSLKMFDPSRDAGSKSIVIANPPFGAERDQPAYPNVWEEYSRESETTILFVKLMFDLLKKGGRCAVIVSEGFLTWGQNSACSLRKILLNDANLKAIISLPQGVFVSKSGQGAKTSILYFEKGYPTDFVWYYKIENDGFSMGTNRKQIEGSQIPELLEHFKEVKQGRKPQDTGRSFCISKEQIETLDPRIAERIRKEVSEKTKEKNVKKREKLIADLNKKLESKKIGKEMYDEKLWQFDNIIEGQIDNEIAKALEKAHSYHFNLQNYRSSLSDEQVKDWRDTFKGVEIKNGSTIEKRFQGLQKNEPKTALQILASFDPKDALQIDIAREYFNNTDKKILEMDETLGKLFEILKETKKFPFAPLRNFLTDLSEERKIELDDKKIYHEPTISTKNNIISTINETLGAYLKVKKRILIKTGDLVIGRMHTQNGSFAIADKEYVSTGTFVPFRIETEKINPKYLFICLKPALLKLGIEDSTGRETYRTEEILAVQIPLPPIDVQNEIVERIEKQKQIIEGAKKIDENYLIDDKYFINYQEYQFRNLFAEPLKNGVNFSKEQVGIGTKFVNVSDLFVSKFINTNNLERVDINEKEISANKLLDGDILFVRSSVKKEGAGYPALFRETGEDIVFCGFIIRARLDKTRVNPEYANYYLRTLEARKHLLDDLAPVAITNINQDKIENIKIPIPPREIQCQIVEKLDRQMRALEGVQLLKAEAEKRIEEILAEVWRE